MHSSKANRKERNAIFWGFCLFVVLQCFVWNFFLYRPFTYIFDFGGFSFCVNVFHQPYVFLVFFLGSPDFPNSSTSMYFLLFWLGCFYFILLLFWERKGVCFGGWGNMGRIWEELEERKPIISLLYEKNILNKKKVVILDMKCYISSFWFALSSDWWYLALSPYHWVHSAASMWMSMRPCAGTWEASQGSITYENWLFLSQQASFSIVGLHDPSLTYTGIFLTWFSTGLMHTVTNVSTCVKLPCYDQKTLFEIGIHYW